MSTESLKELSENQYQSIKAAICPYCEAGLPEIFESRPDGRGFVHFIRDDPRNAKFPCLAERFREKAKGPKQ